MTPAVSSNRGRLNVCPDKQGNTPNTRGYVAIIGAGLSNPGTLPMMMLPPPRPFRSRFCNDPHCQSRFFICSSCYRGQAYCSPACRDRARRDQCRVARRRHQASPEGRLDHRDRQRAFRRRQADRARQGAQKSVTDHTSTPPRPSAMIAPRPMTSLYKASLPPTKVSEGLFCRFCGRRGEFLAPYHESG